MDWLHIFLHHFASNSKLNEILMCGSQPIRLETSTQTRLRGNPFRCSKSMLLSLYQFCEQQNVRLDYRQPFQGGIFQSKNSVFRWHVVVPPIADRGAIFSLRKQRFLDLSLAHFSISDFFWKQIQGSFAKKDHILIVGATGSGKSSLLATLMKEFAFSQRVLILESLPEILTHNPHWVFFSEKLADLEGKGSVTIPKLFEQALRLRPDIITFGEIRNQMEWDTYQQARHTGHQTLATVHGSSYQDILQRFKTSHLSATAILHIKKSSPPEISQIELTSPLFHKKNL